MMGMYTELYLCCRIKGDIPQEVKEVLEYLFGDKPYIVKTIEHEFFKTPRWEIIGHGSSYYFVPKSLSCFVYDKITNSYIMITRSDLKNYDNEIGEFLDWVHPYIDADTGDHLGHCRYECDEIPTILYYGKEDVTTHPEEQ